MTARARPMIAGTAALAACIVISTTTISPAHAAPPSGIYTGMGNCPLNSTAMRDPGNLQVGCVISVTRGGSVTIGTTTVALTSPITLQFGAFWPSTAPVVEFPDGTVANVYTTVPPVGGRTLIAAPLEVPIPGLRGIFPGVTSIFVQVELAGPITSFVPLATGEPFPVFRMPIRLRLLNAFLGLDCFVGSNRNPIVLRPTTGTTNPPPPAEPITGDPGVIGVEPDPNGHNTIVASFAGARLVDNTTTVPSANGCGLFGSLDPLVNRAFGIPSGAGRNTVIFSQVDTSFAISDSIADLSAALADSST